jgi:hypothetical protein
MNWASMKNFPIQTSQKTKIIILPKYMLCENDKLPKARAMLVTEHLERNYKCWGRRKKWRGWSHFQFALIFFSSSLIWLAYLSLKWYGSSRHKNVV